MIEAVAIGDVNMSYPALEPIERARGNPHQPEMRDVHRGLDVLEADAVQEALHVVQRPDESIFERKQLDRELKPSFCGMSADLLRRIDNELPLALRWQQAMLEHALARDEAHVPGREVRSEVEDVLRALDMIGTDGGVEIAETEAGAYERRDRQVGGANVGDIAVAFRRSHPTRVKTDEEIEAVETDLLCFLSPGPPLVLRAEPGRIDQAQLPLRISAHCIFPPWTKR